MKLSVIVEKIGGRLNGDGEQEITSVASLAEAGGGDVSFLSSDRYVDQLSKTGASAVIVPDGIANVPVGVSTVHVKDVDAALEATLTLFAAAPDHPAVGIDATASVGATAKLADDVAVGAHATIGENVAIGMGSVVSPGCVIGRDVEIGSGCFLGANVVIQQRCVVGNNVAIHANSTIGTDGFGYRVVEGRHRKIPHIGIVVIEDDVEIGSNSCIDRAKFGRTVIGRGTKIDNLVQIAHNVTVGENCIIVSQAGIAGSSRLGDYVVLAGQVGVADHCEIGTGALVGAQGGIDRDLEAGAKVLGRPPRPVRAFYRESKLVAELPVMAKELKALKAKVRTLSEKVGE